MLPYSTYTLYLLVDSNMNEKIIVPTIFEVYPVLVDIVTGQYPSMHLSCVLALHPTYKSHARSCTNGSDFACTCIIYIYKVCMHTYKKNTRNDSPFKNKLLGIIILSVPVSDRTSSMHSFYTKK